MSIREKVAFESRSVTTTARLSVRAKSGVPTDQASFENLVRLLSQHTAKEARPPEQVESDADDPAAVILRTIYKGSQYTLMRESAPADAPGHPSRALSPREQEIARMVAKGLPNKAIAGVLEISEWTVGSHLRRIFAKLQVTSRAAMVTQWLQRPNRPGLGA